MKIENEQSLAADQILLGENANCALSLLFNLPVPYHDRCGSDNGSSNS